MEEIARSAETTSAVGQPIVLVALHVGLPYSCVSVAESWEGDGLKY